MLNVRYALKEHGEFAEMHQTDLSLYRKYPNRTFTQYYISVVHTGA